MSMPDDPEPGGVPPMFNRMNGDTPFPPDFAEDLMRRVAAHMAGRGLDPAGLTPLEVEAVQLHVVFSALTQAGFTEDQAVKYLAWRIV